MTIEFHHGALSDDYEKQANRQGFTFGKDAEFVNNVGFGIVAAWIHGVITDSEYDKILARFQKKILINREFLKKLKEGE
jgi:hypothetical protein